LKRCEKDFRAGRSETTDMYGPYEVPKASPKLGGSRASSARLRFSTRTRRAGITRETVEPCAIASCTSVSSIRARCGFIARGAQRVDPHRGRSISTRIYRRQDSPHVGAQRGVYMEVKLRSRVTRSVIEDACSSLGQHRWPRPQACERGMGGRHKRRRPNAAQHLEGDARGEPHVLRLLTPCISKHPALHERPRRGTPPRRAPTGSDGSEPAPPRTLGPTP
jgi:hypothetical protein